MTKKISPTETEPRVTDAEIVDDDRVAAMRADYELKDVTKLRLPEDLAARLAYYEDDDPAFCTNVRRAYKFYTELPEAKGFSPWHVDTKILDYDSGEFNRHGGSVRESIPTPEELRDSGAIGKVRFVIHYYTPSKIVKGGRQKPGIMSIKSKTFDILPVTGGQYVAPQQSQKINLPPAQTVDAYQQIFGKINEMTLQAFNLQMEAIANRGKIVNEGVELGRLKQQMETLSQQNAELQKSLLLAQQNMTPGDPGASVSPVVQLLLEKFGPMLLEKFGMTGAGSTGNIVQS